ncbi:Uncharacterised protein [Vibrio cholerae]|jgi:hypothetical protein|nr:Uncharacterised protein [Vibrio cholerae]
MYTRKFTFYHYSRYDARQVNHMVVKVPADLKLQV